MDDVRAAMEATTDDKASTPDKGGAGTGGAECVGTTDVRRPTVRSTLTMLVGRRLGLVPRASAGVRRGHALEAAGEFRTRRREGSR